MMQSHLLEIQLDLTKQIDFLPHALSPENETNERLKRSEQRTSLDI